MEIADSFTCYWKARRGFLELEVTTGSFMGTHSADLGARDSCRGAGHVDKPGFLDPWLTQASANHVALASFLLNSRWPESKQCYSTAY